MNKSDSTRENPDKPHPEPVAAAPTCSAELMTELAEAIADEGQRIAKEGLERERNGTTWHYILPMRAATHTLMGISAALFKVARNTEPNGQSTGTAHE